MSVVRGQTIIVYIKFDMVNFMMKRIILIILYSVSSIASASQIDFVIPGAVGGGWDLTARKIGETLHDNGVITPPRYVNFSGAGGGRALMEFLKNPQYGKNSLMIQSLPLILRNINGIVPYGFHELSPVCVVMAEYQVIVVPVGSPIKSLSDLLSLIKQDYAKNRILGGSSKGSLDHLTISLIIKAADINQVRYIASNGGAHALKRLYQDDAVALVTGYGEVVDEVKAKQLRVIAITADKQIPGTNIPTAKELGYDVVLFNWRGLFAKPSIAPNVLQQYISMLKAMTKTQRWHTVRQKLGWDDLLICGQAMQQFLIEQESLAKERLTSIE